MIKTAYTYDDIQLTPRYSEIQSRLHISLKTRLTINFNIMIPFIASPMDTICGYDMAVKLLSMGGVGCIHRFMSVEEQCKIVKDIQTFLYQNKEELYPIWGDEKKPILAAVGVGDGEKDRIHCLVSAGCNVILIDVAHGHHINVKNMIGWIKESYPHIDVIGGSVATYEATKDLIEWGADAIRVGIGGGCFTPDMMIKTSNGLKRIADIEIGDLVYTHTGELKPVFNKFVYDEFDEIYDIDGIEATANHKFYVVHKSKVDLIENDDDIHRYAEWIKSENLSEDYFLVEL
jgi:IMP dehydrogenase